MFRHSFGCPWGKITSIIQWADTREPDKHTTMHRTVLVPLPPSTIKNDLDQMLTAPMWRNPGMALSRPCFLCTTKHQYCSFTDKSPLQLDLFFSIATTTTLVQTTLLTPFDTMRVGSPSLHPCGPPLHLQPCGHSDHFKTQILSSSLTESLQWLGLPSGITES